MSSLADHEARRIRAFVMADRCHQMGNHEAEQEWLKLLGKEQRWLDSYTRHPAYQHQLKNQANSQTDQEHQ